MQNTEPNRMFLMRKKLSYVLYKTVAAPLEKNYTVSIAPSTGPVEGGVGQLPSKNLERI